MIRDCPHCYTTVVVQGEECPSCRRRVDELSGADATRISLKIHEGTRLPSSCAFCDAAGARFVPVSRIVGGGGMPFEARCFLIAITSVFGAVGVAIVIAAPSILVTSLLILVLASACLAAALAPFLGVAAFGLILASSSRSGTPQGWAGTRRRVRVVIPLCEDCGKRPVEPLAIDTEALAMTFLVDRRFAARVRM